MQNTYFTQAWRNGHGLPNRHAELRAKHYEPPQTGMRDSEIGMSTVSGKTSSQRFPKVSSKFHNSGLWLVHPTHHMVTQCLILCVRCTTVVHRFLGHRFSCHSMALTSVAID